MTSSDPVVALVGCAQYPEGEDDTRDLVPALAERGVSAAWFAWDDRDVDWPAFGLVVIRATWDYPTRRPEFLTWVDGVPRLANPAAVVRWNSDKTYLRDLAGAGVPVVPTVWVETGQRAELPTGADGEAPDGDVVVKPTVGAGSLGAGRFAPGPYQLRQVQEHVELLHAQGRTAMVQPYLAGVDTAGETALIHLGGAFSHAVRKGPMLPPDTVHGLSGRDELFVPERIEPRPADAEQRALAEAALAAVPGGHDLLYARVDLLPGPDGPVVLELELVEPSLFLRHEPGATGRLADAVVARLDGA